MGNWISNFIRYFAEENSLITESLNSSIDTLSDTITLSSLDETEFLRKPDLYTRDSSSSLNDQQLIEGVSEQDPSLQINQWIFLSRKRTYFTIDDLTVPNTEDLPRD